MTVYFLAVSAAMVPRDASAQESPSGRFTVIGFGVDALSTTADRLREIAAAGGGRYLPANDVLELKRALEAGVRTAPSLAPGDTLLVEITGPEVLARETIVDPFCHVTVPFVGVLAIDGMDARTFEGRLRDVLGRYGHTLIVRVRWLPASAADRSACQ